MECPKCKEQIYNQDFMINVDLGELKMTCPKCEIKSVMVFCQDDLKKCMEKTPTWSRIN